MEVPEKIEIERLLNNGQMIRKSDHELIAEIVDKINEVIEYLGNTQ